MGIFDGFSNYLHLSEEDYAAEKAEKKAEKKAQRAKKKAQRDLEKSDPIFGRDFDSSNLTADEMAQLLKDTSDTYFGSRAETAARGLSSVHRAQFKVDVPCNPDGSPMTPIGFHVLYQPQADDEYVDIVEVLDLADAPQDSRTWGVSAIVEIAFLGQDGKIYYSNTPLEFQKEVLGMWSLVTEAFTRELAQFSQTSQGKMGGQRVIRSYSDLSTGEKRVLITATGHTGGYFTKLSEEEFMRIYKEVFGEPEAENSQAQTQQPQQQQQQVQPQQAQTQPQQPQQQQQPQQPQQEPQQEPQGVIDIPDFVLDIPDFVLNADDEPEPVPAPAPASNTQDAAGNQSSDAPEPAKNSRKPVVSTDATSDPEAISEPDSPVDNDLTYYVTRALDSVPEHRSIYDALPEKKQMQLRRALKVYYDGGVQVTPEQVEELEHNLLLK